MGLAPLRQVQEESGERISRKYGSVTLETGVIMTSPYGGKF